ncbi:HNH endonuclease signature motif containing protein [Nodosilinea sp. AN01ver1]
MSVNQVVAEVLADCARRCCICRRFRPLHLQVHHIVEKKDGGTDDKENLIAICVSCHSDVHSETKLTRRFSRKELQLHRENVCRLVKEGKLLADTAPSDVDKLSASVMERFQPQEFSGFTADIGLSWKAMDLLMNSVLNDSVIKIIQAEEMENGVFRPYQLHSGGRCYLPDDSMNFRAKYPDFLIELLTKNLVSGSESEVYVTEAGYRFVDDIQSANPSFVVVKVQCHSCALHFEISTWYPERHDASTLCCPECRQADGLFSVWKKKRFGFIFEHIPGRDGLIDPGSNALRKPKP